MNSKVTTQIIDRVLAPYREEEERIARAARIEARRTNAAKRFAERAAPHVWWGGVPVEDPLPEIKLLATRVDCPFDVVATAMAVATEEAPRELAWEAHLRVSAGLAEPSGDEIEDLVKRANARDRTNRKARNVLIYNGWLVYPAPGPSRVIYHVQRRIAAVLTGPGPGHGEECAELLMR
jgi:hypothetical protein